MNNSGIRILIAEDSAIQAESLRRLLVAEDYSVSVATNGAEGLLKAKELKPQIVISDIMMPEMNGFELCRHIKSDIEISSTPVILLTSLNDPTDVISGLECGADNFIVKPYDERHLLTRIKHILLNRELQETSRTQMGVEVHFAGRKYFITSEKKQILDLLISTYESAVQKNTELIKVQEELKILNEELEQKVRERTATLAEEIEMRKRAEKTLKEEKTFTENALNTLNDIFFVLDLEGRLVRWNKTANMVLGYSDMEMISMKHTDFFRGIDIDRVTAAIQTAVRDGSVGLEAQFVAKDGRQIPYEIFASLLRDHQGNFIGISGVGRDITERKKLENQLRHAQKMEAIGTLAGGIAHDFNNILNVIMGYGTMALDSNGIDQLVREQINEVLNAADKAANLTKRLLLFSRQQVSDMKSADVNDIVISIEKMLRRIIGEDIEFSTNLTGKKMVIMVDVSQIEQVLMNLAVNARDAMPAGGSLTIATELRELDADFFDAYGYGEPGKYALIQVSDSGVGIDAETQSKIFDPFFTTKEVGKGTGLGLSIAYGIIKQHNGYIKVYSESEKGTTFKIWLPVIDDTAEKKLVVEVLSSPKGGTETILVAEDDASLRKLKRIVLESVGYNVIIAEDGEDAITKFKENRDRINLIILDMIMPKKSGREAYEEIRKISPDIRTLFASGYTLDIINRKELLDEAMDFIHKPVSSKDLLRKVREILDR